MLSWKEVLSHQTAVVGIYGTGGFGREVMPMAQASLRSAVGMDAGQDNIRFVFVEEKPRAESINGIQVVSEASFINETPGSRFYAVCVADSIKRQLIAEKLSHSGALPLSLTAPNATVYTGNDIGEGAILCANSIVTSNAKIGKHFHANIFAYVAHDCVIGDYVTFAPRVSCNGNIHIEDFAYIGTSAVLKQGQTGKPLTIGKGAVVGMGAVVTKDVPAGAVVVGNPAREMKRE